MDIVTGVCEKSTPDKKTGWKFSSENPKSGAGLQFLLLGHMAKAQAKGCFCSQTPVSLGFVFDDGLSLWTLAVPSLLLWTVQMPGRGGSGARSGRRAAGLTKKRSRPCGPDPVRSLSLSLYIYIYIYIYVYTHIHIYMHVYVHICISLSLSIYIYIYTYVHIHIYIYTSIHTYIYIYIYIHMYMHMYVYIYIYI